MYIIHITVSVYILYITSMYVYSVLFIHVKLCIRKSFSILVYTQICQDQENSLLLKLNTTAPTSQLPLSLYESLIEIVEGKAKVLYSMVPYTLATEEAERIGVDHIARVSVSGSVHTSAGSDIISFSFTSVFSFY